MLFKDRADAGKKLAKALVQYAGRKDAVVLALPRGGLAVGYELSVALHAPLSVMVSKKISMPGNEELAIGAVSHDGAIYMDEEAISAGRVSRAYVEQERVRLVKEIEDKLVRYTGSAGKPNLRGKIVMVADDGVATGATMIAACKYVRLKRPARVVIAIPVAPFGSRRDLECAADEVVCLQYADPFWAVGQFYEEFRQVDDEEAMAFLARARRGMKNPGSREG